MNIGMVGIAALYWPKTMAEGIARCPGVHFTACATLGIADKIIRQHLGMGQDEFVKKYNVAKYVSPEEMMGNEKIDAFVICTRHTDHVKWVKRIAPFKKPIYILKTFTTTMTDADTIVRLGKKYGIRIIVGPSARYLPFFAAAKKAVDAGAIGKPFSLRIAHHHGTIDGFHKNDSYRNPREGGPELSLGWYLIDLVMHFLGQKVERICAEYGNFTTPNSPFMDCGKMVLRMKDGAMASCDMYFCNRFTFPSWEMEIVGNKGAIFVRQPVDAPASVILYNKKGGTPIPCPEKVQHWEMFWLHDLMHKKKNSLTAEYAREVTRFSIEARKKALPLQRR